MTTHSSFRRVSHRRLLLAGASVMAIMVAAPLQAASLRSAVSTQAAATAAAVSSAQNQAAAAAAAAAQGNANLNRNASRLRDAVVQQAAAARARVTYGTFTGNGLGPGALQPVTDPNSTTDGLTTWTGANLPVADADNPNAVTIEQTQSRAVLTWESFNVGRDTTLTYDQQGNSDWIALNRVVGDTAAPSQILGSIKADGTLLVINQNGILFGAGSQINVHSLIATTAEIGRSLDEATARTIAQRNAEFLEYGLTGYAETNPTASNATTFAGLTNASGVANGVVEVQEGASIISDGGGVILLAASTVTNAGHLSAADGQVSLAGLDAVYRQLTLKASDGSSTALDPNVRGYLVQGQGGSVINRGVIEADRGYISLGAAPSMAGSRSTGTVVNSGILSSTTAVSANGAIDLYGDNIAMAPGSLILIAPDGNGESIPQDPTSLSAFKTSKVRIGDFASTVLMDTGAEIVAPSGDVTIGAPAGATMEGDRVGTWTGAGHITINSGALIDVSGLRDVWVPISAYNLAIKLKGNELADSGGYQDSALNGETVWIDARLSGVREDGVAWIGSPLISAAAYYEAVGASAPQLMTTGGNVVLGTNGVTTGATTPSVTVNAGSLIDISGGWVTYEAGTVKTSQLLTRDGRVVDIGKASLNDIYIGVYTGSSTSHSRWGVTDTWRTLTRSTVTSSYTEGSYTEGRDAGTLTVKTALAVLEGALNADAHAGLKQIAVGQAGSGTSAIHNDLRNVQEARTQLPSGGLLFVQLMGDAAAGNSQGGGGGDIAVVDEAHYARAAGTTVLSDALLSDSGLSQVSLWSRGSITVAADADVSLSPGGVFDAYAGRALSVAGTVSVPSGSILLETAYFDAKGSLFTTTDDTLAPGSFDVIVTGTLSVAGLWVNDRGKSGAEMAGGAYLDGGAIVITSAATVTDAIPIDYSGSGSVAVSTDVSGSIHVENAQLIDLSGGGRVKPNGALDLSGRGGDLALLNQSAFFQSKADDIAQVAERYGAVTGFRPHYSVLGVVKEVPVNPGAITSTVQFDAGRIRATGFGGGGTFTLWAPDVAFGSGAADDTALATRLPLEFFQSGFANYNITSYKTAFLSNQFVDSSGDSLGGTNAVLWTQTFTVKNGETLVLSQSVLPSDSLTAGQRAALLGLETGGDVYSILTAEVPSEAWNQKAVNLTLDGMVELVVEGGGSIVSAPGAVLTVPKLLNQGRITLRGGSIVQKQTLPAVFGQTVYGVTDLSEVLTVQDNGTSGDTSDDTILETANSKIVDYVDEDGTTHYKTNAQVAYASMIYQLGTMAAGDGIVLATGSTTDLSGISVINPYATDTIGTPMRTGTIHDGGSIVLASVNTSTLDGAFFHSGRLNSLDLSVSRVTREAALTIASNAHINLNGASDTYMQPVGGASRLTSLAVWSNGGSISAVGGFSISSEADIRANGGVPSAQGGTLELADVVLTDGVADAANELSTALINQSGFTTLAVLGSLKSDGAAHLTLDRALYLASRPYEGETGGLTTGDKYAVVVGAGGDIVITAPYIGLLSSMHALSGTMPGTEGTHSVTLNATKAFDVSGAVLFDKSVANLTLTSAGDLRLIGVADYGTTHTGATTTTPVLTGLLRGDGNLTIRAAQVYPTTGSTFFIETIDAAGKITFARSTATLPAAPYSAGGNLTVTAATIEQGGVIRVPLGSLTLDAVDSLTLENGSYTEVSANGLIIPYGTTTDGVEWYFTPTSTSALSQLPIKLLALAGDDIAVKSGAVVNVSGGGDVTAYEFAAGAGGSRDVLNSYNDDAYTSTTGCTYAGCAQAYAIVPGLSNGAVAAYDPIYSANYAELSSVSGVGKRVQLNLGDGLKWYTLLPAQYATLPGGLLVVQQPGITDLAAGTRQGRTDGTVLAAGSYGDALSGARESGVHLFAVQSQGVYRKYSSITLSSGNAYFTDLAQSDGTITPQRARDAGRLVLNAGSSLIIDAAVRAAAGSGGRGAQVDIGGSAINIVSAVPAGSSGALYITAGSLTNLNAESLLIGAIRTDNADGTTTLNVTAGSISVSNDENDALRAPEIVLAATGSITIADGAVVTATGTMSDTRDGAYILGDDATSGTGALVRVANGLERLASRSNFDGSATLDIGAATLSGKSVMFDSSGTITLSDALALENATSVALGAGRIGIGIADPDNYGGVVVTENMRTLLTQTGGRLTLRSQTVIDFAGGNYTFGDIRFDAAALAGTGGDVGVTGDTVTLGNVGAAGYVCATCDANSGSLSIVANKEILFAGGLMATKATILTSAAPAKLAADTRVVLKAGTVITTASSTVTLVEDAVIIVPKGTAVSLPAELGLVSSTATEDTLVVGATVTASAFASTSEGTISFMFPDGATVRNASNYQSTLGSGTGASTGAGAEMAIPTGAAMDMAAAAATQTKDFFTNGVTLTAAQGIFATGAGGGLDTGTADLTVHTPYLGDRASSAVAGQAIIPGLALVSRGAVVITKGSGSTDAAVLGGVPGTAISISGRSVSVAGTRIHASAGTVDVLSQTGLILSDGAVIETPAYLATYGDDADSTTAPAPGGRIRLIARAGDIDLRAGTLVSVGRDAEAVAADGAGTGNAGRLELSAVAGDVRLDGRIDGTADADATGGTFALETGGGVDLVALNTLVGARGFTGGFEVHSHTGDLILDTNQTLRSGSVKLTADGGFVTIAGIIDTSGTNGGDIELYGNRGVTLEATARLDAHAEGYADADPRQASAGDVTLGTDFTDSIIDSATGIVSGTSGTIVVRQGALIDATARRTGNRVIPLESGLGYYYVDGDTGGTLYLRAPVVNGTVDVTVDSAASVKAGAAGVVVEGFRRWDLATVAASGHYTGVGLAGGAITLDASTGLDTWTAGCGVGGGTCTLGATVVAGLNFLGDRDWTGSYETVASFIQDFNISTGPMGGLAFQSAPGVELAHDGAVTLASNWNLAAGAVDTATATADGLMAMDPALNKLYVVPGREADLLARYTAMIYRPDGRSASAAPVVTIRAGGDLTVAKTLTDGFFVFQDSSDTDYLQAINATAMGNYAPALYVKCNGPTPCGSASGVQNWVSSTTAPSTSPGKGYLLIDLAGMGNMSTPAAPNMYAPPASDPVAAPYNAQANSPIAASNGLDGATAFSGGVESASFRLVAGSDLASTAPLATKAGINASASLTGTSVYSYTYLDDYVGTVVARTTLLVGAQVYGSYQAGTPNASAETFYNSYLAANPTANANDMTYVKFKSYNMTRAPGYSVWDAIASAIGTWLDTYAAGSYSKIGTVSATTPWGATGVTMPFGLAAQLMAHIQTQWPTWVSTTYTGGAAANLNIAASTASGTPVTVTANGMVRSGNGSIHIATAGNVDLRAGLAADSMAAAVAVYTAGQRAATGTVTATNVTTHASVEVTLGANMLAGGLYLENGGDVSITAGGDVLGLSNLYLRMDSDLPGNASPSLLEWMPSLADSTGTRYAGQSLNPSRFTTGIGALAGGDVTVTAGRDIDDVAVAATPAIRVVSIADGGRAIQFLGDSDVALSAGRDILGGLAYVTSGTLDLDAQGGIAAAGWRKALGGSTPGESLTRLRVLNATATLTAGRNASFNWDYTLPWSRNRDNGWYSGIAGLSATANGGIRMTVNATGSSEGALLPGSLALTALTGDLTFGNNDASRSFILMEPNADGQLVLLADGSIGAVTIVMDDADPANMSGPDLTLAPGAISTRSQRGFSFPTVTSRTTEGMLRLYHNQDITHAADPVPVMVFANRDIADMTLVAPKQARVVAGGDIVNMVFFGQNLHAGDITRIKAAGDITATATVASADGAARPTLQGNAFVIGGPGAFFLEAGGDLGPFLNSATVTDGTTYGGGVLSVGAEWNPWLTSAVNTAGGGADLYVMFGLGAAGPDYAGFRDAYVNPATAGALAGGGYGAELVAWMRAPWLSEGEAYAAFLALPPLEQRLFLLSRVYFNELEQVAVTTGESYQEYSRGYEAVNILFPAANGFTANRLEGGDVDTALVHTGNLDLRLATLQSSRGGDIRILGPGGSVLAGSVVRTATQATRRNYSTSVYAGRVWAASNYWPATGITAIPVGLEGILTLRGGTIESFTDGSLVLNQSRLFTQNGGDIVLWSSNGDLNAGQGPKTSASFPPIAVTFDWNLYGEVDEQNGVSGAGIAAFQPEVGIAAPDVYMLAPRGTVDAGDAGIRAAGDISVLAYQVRNADNISVGGRSFGVPVVAGPNLGALTAASDTAGSAAGAAEDAARASRQTGPRNTDLPSIITVEVIGYGGGDGGGSGAGGQEDTGRRTRDRHGYDPNGAVRVTGLGEGG